MISRAWITSFAAFAELALALLLLTPAPAIACADPPDIADETTFDPRVLGDATPAGLYFDPYTAGFGEPCADCAHREMLADWAGWLGPEVRPEDWEAILLHAPLPDIDGLVFKLKGKAKEAPVGFAESSVLRLAGTARERAVAGLYFVGFARRVEALASLEASPGPETEALLRNGDAALDRAKDGFLRQRYAFQLLRLRFYRRDWPGAVAFHQANTAVLDGPSESLRWRARYYLAGALKRSGSLGRANLELARIFARFTPLAGPAAMDFRPVEEKDWQQTLALAESQREKAELWALVGLTRDGVAAIEAILALDPGSRLVALLTVRELSRLEARGRPLDELEAIAVREAARASDRPWVFELVAGHIAALKGKLPAARAHLEAARRARPGDATVAAQAEASLALALARSWTPEQRLEPALAHATVGFGPEYPRAFTVRGAVRRALSERCTAANRPIDAALFGASGAPAGSEDFLRSLIARVGQPATDWDRLGVQASGYTVPGLYHVLGASQLVRGDLTSAAQSFKKAAAASGTLGTDPFVIHVRDCHDCDHEKYAKAKWTAASVAARLVELERSAHGEGDRAAQAAFELGNGLYNLTWYGNARVFLEGTGYATRDTRPAEAWYRRAFDSARSRELKAKAAFMAAKCELAQRLEAKPPEREDEPLPVPKTWFPVVKQFEDTRYHQEVLAECGHYRTWRASEAR